MNYKGLGGTGMVEGLGVCVLLCHNYGSLGGEWGVITFPNHPNQIRIRLKRIMAFGPKATFNFQLSTFNFHFPSELTGLVNCQLLVWASVC